MVDEAVKEDSEEDVVVSVIVIFLIEEEFLVEVEEVAGRNPAVRCGPDHRVSVRTVKVGFYYFVIASVPGEEDVTYVSVISFPNKTFPI